MKKNNDYDYEIDESCRCCELSSATLDEERVLCRVRGVVSSDFYCRKFSYDALKRTPKRLPPIPRRDAIDGDETAGEIINDNYEIIKLSGNSEENATSSEKAVPTPMTYAPAASMPTTPAKSEIAETTPATENTAAQNAPIHFIAEESISAKQMREIKETANAAAEEKPDEEKKSEHLGYYDLLKRL